MGKGEGEEKASSLDVVETGRFQVFAAFAYLLADIW